MMRAAATAALLLALAPASQAAPADKTFDTFKRFCVETHADAAAMAAVADRAHWAPMPQSLIDKFNHGAKMDNLAGRMRSSQTSVTFVIAEHGTSPDGSFIGNLCVFLSVPAPKSDIERSARALAGVDADPDSPGAHAMYMWQDLDGRHVPVKQGDPDMARLIAEKRVSALMVTKDDQGAMLGFMIPTEQTVNADPPDGKTGN